MIPLSLQQARALIDQHTRTVANDVLVKEPLVSAALIAFQHKQYLKAALEGVLAQQTDFPIEIVIGDDCSTDGSIEILLDYQRRFPQQIKLLLANKNLGGYTGTGILNLMRVLDACRGKYIALLECDDCWTDPTKLQRQINILECDDTVVLCHHRARILNEMENSSQLSQYPYRKSRLSLKELLRRTANSFCTGSIVFRKAAFPGLPESFLRLELADWPMIMLVLQSGDAVFIDREMGIYRQHAAGHWTSKQSGWHNWQLLKMAKATQRHFSPAYQRQFGFLLWSRRFALGQSLAATSKWRSRVLLSAVWRQKPVWAVLKRVKQLLYRHVLRRG